MKRGTSFVIASLLIVGGCSKKAEEGTVQKQPLGGAATAPPAPPVEAAKPLTGQALALRYQSCIDMINAGKLEDFRRDCLDDSFHFTDFGDASHGNADELIARFKHNRTLTPDMKLTPQLVLVSGRNLFAINLVTGTNTGPLNEGMPASNKKLGFLMFHRLELDDANKATGEWSYMDPATVMGQLGIGPKELPPTRPAMDKGIDGAPIIVVSTDDAKEKANVEVANKLVVAQEANKVPDMLALYAPDAVVADQTEPADMKGTKAFEPMMKMMAHGIKDPKTKTSGLWAAGDYVVRMGTFGGNHHRDIGPFKASGKDFAIDFAQVLKIDNGKITHNWMFGSGTQVATQLGLLKAPPLPPRAKAPDAPAAGSAAAPATPKAPPMPSPTPAPPAAGSAATPAAPAPGGGAAPAAGSAATK